MFDGFFPKRLVDFAKILGFSVQHVGDFDICLLMVLEAFGHSWISYSTSTKRKSIDYPAMRIYFGSPLVAYLFS